MSISIPGGAAVGLWASDSRFVRRWVMEADGDGSSGGVHVPRLAWGMATGLAAGALGVPILVGGQGRAQPLALLGLVGWACALCVLGLIDAEQFVLPTPILRFAAVTTVVALMVAATVSGNWRHLFSALLTVVGAGCVYGAWAWARPHGLGFGDVRMACLVALGVGASSMATALVVLSCAPLAAGVVAKYAGRRAAVHGMATASISGPALEAGRCAAGHGAARPVAVPLGPFLAVAGIVGVVAVAI
jgi:leader peptidase (prepilin peptidase)/N-methyltransferase